MEPANNSGSYPFKHIDINIYKNSSYIFKLNFIGFPLCQDSCHLRSKQRLAPRPPAGGLGAAPVIFAAKVFFP